MIRHGYRLPLLAALCWALAGTPAPAQKGKAPKAEPQTKAAPVADKVPDMPVPEVGFGPEVSFADQFGPYVIAGRNGSPKEGRAVFDTRDGKQVGVLQGKIEFLEKPSALSPDGKLFACAGGFRRTPSITVVDLAAGKPREIALDKKADYVEFIGPARLLAVANFENLFTVIDTATGKADKPFKTGRRVGFQPIVAVSPDGKTLAVPEDENFKKTLQFYDLTTGQKGATVPLPEAKPFGYGCEGLAFSADAKRLAGVFKGGNKPTALVWQADGGKLTAELPLTDAPKNGFFNGPKFQWSPDGKACLVYGELVIDPESGKSVWKADPPFTGA